MAIADFIHLKVRSAYSLTEGANKVDKVVALAKDNAMPAVAVTFMLMLGVASAQSLASERVKREVAEAEPAVGKPRKKRRRRRGGRYGDPAAARTDRGLLYRAGQGERV